MEESRIRAVEHVHIETSHGLDDDLRWFYGEVAGLEEKAQTDPESPVLCFKSARIELRLTSVDRPHIETETYRITLLVESLNEAIELLEERSVAYERLTGIGFTDRRVGTRDPAGNRIILKQHWPHAPL